MWIGLNEKSYIFYIIVIIIISIAVIGELLLFIIINLNL